MSTNRLDMRCALENLVESGLESVTRLHILRAVLVDLGGHAALAEHVQVHAEMLAEDLEYAGTVLRHVEGSVAVDVEVSP